MAQRRENSIWFPALATTIKGRLEELFKMEKVAHSSTLTSTEGIQIAVLFKNILWTQKSIQTPCRIYAENPDTAIERNCLKIAKRYIHL